MTTDQPNIQLSIQPIVGSIDVTFLSRTYGVYLSVLFVKEWRQCITKPYRHYAWLYPVVAVGCPIHITNGREGLTPRIVRRERES